jgi:hypothetical protein
VKQSRRERKARKRYIHSAFLLKLLKQCTIVIEGLVGHGLPMKGIRLEITGPTGSGAGRENKCDTRQSTGVRL